MQHTACYGTLTTTLNRQFAAKRPMMIPRTAFLLLGLTSVVRANLRHGWLIEADRHPVPDVVKVDRAEGSALPFSHFKDPRDGSLVSHPAVPQPQDPTPQDPSVPYSEDAQAPYSEDPQAPYPEDPQEPSAENPQEPPVENAQEPPAETPQEPPPEEHVPSPINATCKPHSKGFGPMPTYVSGRTSVRPCCCCCCMFR